MNGPADRRLATCEWRTRRFPDAMRWLFQHQQTDFVAAIKEVP
jgi:hypothetical protein